MVMSLLFTYTNLKPQRLLRNVVLLYQQCCHVRFSIKRPNDFEGTSAVSKYVEKTLIPSVAVQKKKEALKIEMENLVQSGKYDMPERIPEEAWEDLLKIISFRKRLEFYKYLKRRELKKTKNKAKAKQKLEMKRKESFLSYSDYGLHMNSIFANISKQTIREFYNNNLIHALLFGQDLVIDLGFDDHMNSVARRHCIGQILMIYALNKQDYDPFHLNFCNCGSTGSIFSEIRKSVPLFQWSQPLMTVTEKNYTDLFPKDRLVCLTSHTDEELVFSHDDIYIIGGLVQKKSNDSRIFIKAKKDGIRMARFPFHQFEEWKHCYRHLKLDTTFKILLKMKNTSDWEEAFAHLPTHKPFENIAEEVLYLYNKKKK